LRVDHATHIHPRVPAASGDPAIMPSQAIQIAMIALPDARLAWVETPAGNGGDFKLRMQVLGDPSFRFPHSFVWVTADSGKVVAIQDARKGAAGTVINNWVHPLHDGSAGGLTGRMLAAIAGLVPLFLFVTGFLRWRIRRKNH
jgi:uncharacterized iron-regulated membrane protein